MRALRFVLIASMLATVSMASGGFSTGGSELLKFSGTGWARWDLYGQEGSNPENTVSSAYNINWAPKLNDFVAGRIDLELRSSSGAVKLADMYLDLELSPNFSLRGGQFKVPFGYSYTRPSSSMYFGDRAYISGAGDYKNYRGRDNGICLSAEFAPVSVDLGLYNGTGDNKKADNDRNRQLAARATVDVTDWLALGGSFSVVGRPETEEEHIDPDTGDTTIVTVPSWSSNGLNFFASGSYPLGPSAKLLFEGEYAMLGRTGPDVSGMEKSDGSCMSVALAAEFGTGDGFVRALRPAVRYDMVDPSTMLASGADAPSDNITVLDFCLALDLLSSRNTLMLGGRNYSFEDEDSEGYTDMYLSWRMRF